MKLSHNWISVNSPKILLLLIVLTSYCNCLQHSHKKTQLSVGKPSKNFISNVRKCCQGENEAMDADRNCLSWTNSEEYPLQQVIETMEDNEDEDEQLGKKKISLNIFGGKPSCKEKEEKLSLMLNSETSFDFLVDINPEANKSNFALNSNFLARLYSVSEDSYHDSFCVERLFNHDLSFIGVVAQVCQPDLEILCQTESCTRTCCPPAHFINVDSHECQHDDSIVEDEIQPYKISHVLFGQPKCTNRRVLNSKNDSFVLLDNGHLQFGDQQFDHNAYCLNRNQHWDRALICLQDNHIPNMSKIIPYLYLISAIFLIFAFLHIFKNRDKLFGLMTLCMIATLFLFYLILVFPHFLGVNHVNGNPVLCQMEGFAIQFLYLSAIGWLNCVCFVIWKSFRRIQRCPDIEPKPWKNATFYRYASWACGFPILVSLLTALLHFLPPSLTSGLPVLPEIGRSSCFLGPDTPTLFYLHAFAGPCIILNLVMFSLTAWNLCCGVWANSATSGPNRKYQKRHVFTVAKMSVVVGVTWSAEVASWLVGRSLGRPAWVQWASFSFDCVNALQGVLLFLALYVDRAVLKRMGTCLGLGGARGRGVPVFQARYRVRRESLASEGEVESTLGMSSLGSVGGGAATQEGSPLKAVMGALASPIRRTYSYEVNKEEQAQ